VIRTVVLAPHTPSHFGFSDRMWARLLALRVVGSRVSERASAVGARWHSSGGAAASVAAPSSSEHGRLTRERILQLPSTPAISPSYPRYVASGAGAIVMPRVAC